MCEMIMKFLRGIKLSIQGNHIELDEPNWRDGEDLRYEEKD